MGKLERCEDSDCSTRGLIFDIDGLAADVRRNEGFWLFLLSNILWVIWGLYDRAYAFFRATLFLPGLQSEITK
jgi:hypothetical protein